MLEGYFANVPKNSEEAIELNQRLLAVQAALEIAKQSVGNWHQSTVSRVNEDLSKTANEIDKLADAIQSALKK
ncbi:hypothetical protein JT31_01915 [Cedecea neteri]|uniref:Uncharacterized protein n=1 Tax=Cedecea neteri TaxID=158822 RepID=A0A089PTW0_9ENTR|nr:hypothetical protein [Cedecea neteri]AIR03418.1 hypothetical protein JT31_01915 [Cedecea neteri]